MSVRRLLALMLVAGGILGLAYGGFTWSQETGEATVGSVKVSVNEKQRVRIPPWVSIGALVIGGAMLAGSYKRKRS